MISKIDLILININCNIDLSVLMEMLWDSLHDWNVVMEGYTLYRRDRPGGAWCQSCPV